MAENKSSSFENSLDRLKAVVDELERESVDLERSVELFREGRTLVARCEKEGKHSLSQLSVESFNEVIATKSDIRIDADVYEVLGARNVVKRYRSEGAAGGKPFESQLAGWKQRLGM